MSTRCAAAMAVVVAIVSLPAPHAQQAAKADADYLRKGYETYRSMAGP